MPTLETNGIHFYYEIHGKGFPLVLVSPFACNTGIFRRYIPTLSKDFQVIVFDHRGSGRTTTTPPPYTIEILSDDMTALMEGLKIPCAHFAGFSMGSIITQAFALRHPKKIDKGILVATFNRFPKTALMQTCSMGKLFRYGANPALIFETLLPWIYSNTFLSDSKNIESTIHDMLNDTFCSSEGFVGQLAALANCNFTDQLSQINAEMLIIAGKEDLYTPPSFAQAVKAHLKFSKIQILPEVGHMLYIEKLEEVIKLMQNFLSR